MMRRLFFAIQFGGSLADLSDMAEEIKADYERRQTELQTRLDAAEAELDRAQHAFKAACAKAIEKYRDEEMGVLGDAVNVSAGREKRDEDKQ